MFSPACKQFVSGGLAPVLIWTNDFFEIGSHLELQQSPWPPPMANKRHRHNKGVKDLVRRRQSGGWNFIRMEVELTRGVAGLHQGRTRLFGENNREKREKKGIQADGCDP